MRPFDSKLDYALANWFFTSDCSKGDINAFLSNPWLAEIRDMLSFRTADELYEQVERIPHGLAGDGWQAVPMNLTVPSRGSRYQREVQFLYRDVVNVARYLIGFKPFRAALSYAPIKLWDDRPSALPAAQQQGGSRVYRELHHAERWWEVQSDLPDGATLMPIILATDKTDLSQHQGDLSARPIYMTIGNLNAETRRRQRSSAYVLVGFMPDIHNDQAADPEKVLEMEMWHACIRVLLERTSDLVETTGSGADTPVFSV